MQRSEMRGLLGQVHCTPDFNLLGIAINEFMAGHGEVNTASSLFS